LFKKNLFQWTENSEISWTDIESAASSTVAMPGGLGVTGGIFAILLALTAKELFWTETGTDAVDMDREIRAPKMSQYATPTIKFLFCYSWGYRNAFEQMSQAIRDRYPGLQVEGGNFPPPPLRQMTAQALSALKFILIIILISGQNPFLYLNIATPEAFTWAIENKVYACMMVFFVSNMIETQLISTGAFEIDFNGMNMWSKIQTGRIPTAPELYQMIEQKMEMAGGGNKFS